MRRPFAPLELATAVALAVAFTIGLLVSSPAESTARTEPAAEQPLAAESPVDRLHDQPLPKGAPVHVEKLCYPNAALFEHRPDEVMLQEWNLGWRLDHVSGLPTETRLVRTPTGQQQEHLTCFLAVFVPLFV